MKVIKNNIYLLKYLYKFSKSRIPITFVSTIFVLINDLILNVLFLPFIVSAVANNYPISKLFFYCGIMILTRIFIEIFNSWNNSIYIPISDSKIEFGFQNLLYNKLETIDLIKYDDPEFYNNSIWVCNDVNKRAIEVINTFFNWLGDLLMIGSIIAIIVTFEPIILVLTVLPSLISLIFNNRINNVIYEFNHINQLPDRKINYVNKLFTSSTTAKEFRLFPDIFHPLIKLYHQSLDNKKSYIKQYGKKIAFLISFVEIATVFCSHVLAMIYLAYKVILSNTINPGIVIALTNSIWQISGRIDSLLGLVNQMKKHSLYIDNYRKFITMESAIDSNDTGKIADTQANSIKFEHVSFQYPNSCDCILKDINMEVGKGKKIAIVGGNGSGKTTLIKLIMRLYLPQEGTIYFDNIPEEVYQLQSLRNRFGVIFQDFQLYAANVIENVILNHANGSDHERELVDETLKHTGLYDRIYQEKNNIYTNVLKDFDKDGLILSGGQAQKLAIARIFAKDCGVVIMDEPSSALDPISEYEIHNNMMDAAKDKTVILISHRLSTTKNADKIFYLDNGQIVEEGSHDELMQMKGRYAEMFLLQSEKYKLDNEMGCLK